LFKIKKPFIYSRKPFKLFIVFSKTGLFHILKQQNKLPIPPLDFGLSYGYI